MRGERRRWWGRAVPATALALVVAITLVAGAAAEKATETSTFGADGVAVQEIGAHFGETEFTSVEARADGRVVAQRSNRLEAYLPSGAPDPSYPARKFPHFGRSFPLPGGKRLIVAGEKLTRLNPDGSIDTSFGGGTIDGPIEADAVAELPSGRILLASTATVGTHVIETQISLIFLESNGSPVLDMGREGEPVTYLPGQGARVVAIVPAGDGGALVVGSSFLLKVRADGSADPGFGSDGVVSDLYRLAGARFLADGGIEAVASGTSSSDSRVYLIRLTADGARDQSFGPDGIRSFDLGARISADAALWEPDGSVVVGGLREVVEGCPSSKPCEAVPFLVSFDPSAALDAGFGQGGSVILRPLAAAPGVWRDGGVKALSRRPDGALVVGGSAAPEQTVAFLAALSPQGALLPDFGEGGIVRVREPEPARHLVAGFACLPSGGLLSVGSADVGTDDTAVLVRSAADGSIDRSFGENGYATLGDARFGEALAVDAKGRALVGIYGVPRSKLMLLDTDGMPVPDFGSGGVVELPNRVRVKALAFAPNDDLILLGNDDTSGDPEPGVVMRFHANGKRYTDFGKNGRVDLRPGGREVRASALALDARGRILVAGTAHRHFALARLLPGGAPDPSFGARGWVLPSAGRAWALAKGVALARAGSRIYLAGVARNGDQLRLALMKFRPDGTPMAGFAKAGRRTVTIPPRLAPESVIAAGGDALVVLNEGPRPLVSFSRNGKVRRERVAGAPSLLSEVRGVRCGDRALVGGTGLLSESRHYAYFLSSRALP